MDRHDTQGLEGDALGNSSGSGPEEVPTGLWPEVARVGEDGAPTRGAMCTLGA
jgi:hypothetical protein